MNRSWAALVISLISLGLAIAVAMSRNEKDPELVALRARIDAQEQELAELRRRTVVVAETQGSSAGARQAPVAAPMPEPVSTTEPARPDAKPADPVQEFLTAAKISPAEWRAIQAVNESWKSETWRLAVELVNAPPAEATTRLDEVESRRVRGVSAVLDPTRRAAYEEFRLRSPMFAQIVCGRGGAKRLLPMY